MKQHCGKQRMMWGRGCLVVMFVLAINGQAQLFNNTNTDAVMNCPNGRLCSSQFAVATTTLIEEIYTYHWNNGQGAPHPGALSITDVNG